MFRYLALVWNPADAAQALAAAELTQRLEQQPKSWICSVNRPGLRAYCAGERRKGAHSHVLDCGVIFGTVFERDGAGRSPVEKYWGRYAAFLYDPVTSCTRVLRDPTGALPCFFTRHLGVDIFFSAVEDCEGLDLPPFTIDWDYVRAYLSSPGLNSSQTGLKEVTELQPGECIEIGKDRRRQSFYWRAENIARSNPIENPSEAAAALRAATRACVHAWASCYENILHRLSGGLDSSIVMSCLSDAPSRPELTALHGYIEGTDSDERGYARLAAQRAGCRLIEHEIDVSQVRLERMLDIRKTERPSSYFSYLVGEQIEPRLIGDLGPVSAGFSGGGGDQLFYAGRAAPAAVDYFRRHGLRREFLNVVLNTARMDNVSFWNVLGFVMRDSAGRSSDQLPSGKAWHVELLASPQPFYNPLGGEDDPEPVFPLASQPLIELCLRIPAYVLTIGGWDRGLARRAFAQDVPWEILTRQSKAGAERYAKAVFLNNLQFLRELLLDGLLVKKGLLDKAELETVLSERSSGVARVFEHASTEAWLRTHT